MSRFEIHTHVNAMAVRATGSAANVRSENWSYVTIMQAGGVEDNAYTPPQSIHIAVNRSQAQALAAFFADLQLRLASK